MHARAVKLANFPLHSVVASKQVTLSTARAVAVSSQIRSGHAGRCPLTQLDVFRVAAPAILCSPLLHHASWCVPNPRLPCSPPPTATRRARICSLTRALSKPSWQPCSRWQQSQSKALKLEATSARVDMGSLARDRPAAAPPEACDCACAFPHCSRSTSRLFKNMFQQIFD